MKSEQERLVKSFSEHSMGAPYVFATDEYRKASSTREPADLVWVCNGCVMLMYMKQTSKLSKAIKGNLSQAAGWLRAWREGQLLTGSNKHNKFSLGFQQANHVVVVSVVRSHEHVAIYHHDELQKMSRYGVAHCVTLPESVLEYIARWGGGAVDLVNIIQTLAECEGAASANIMDMVRCFHEQSALYADPEKRWIHDDDYGILRAAKSLFLGLRSTGLGVLSRGDGTDPAWIFNDLTQADYLMLVVQLANMIWSVEVDNAAPVIVDIPLTRYRCVVGVYRSRAHGDTVAFVREVIRVVGTEGHVPVNTFVVILDTVLQTPLSLFERIEGPSLIKMLIDQWKARVVRPC